MGCGSPPLAIRNNRNNLGKIQPNRKRYLLLIKALYIVYFIYAPPQIKTMKKMQSFKENFSLLIATSFDGSQYD